MSETRKTQYSREEVAEILQRAVDRMSTADTDDAVLHEELIQSAREAGLDAAAVEEAAASLATDRENERTIADWKARRWRGFVSHFVSWLIVSGGLGILTALFSTQVFLCPIVLWGMAVAFHGYRASRSLTADDVQRVLNRQQRRRERAARKREARQVRERRRKLSKDLEVALEAGVSNLIAIATKKLEESARSRAAPRPDSSFNRYVARQEARSGASPSVASGGTSSGRAPSRGGMAEGLGANPSGTSEGARAGIRARFEDEGDAPDDARTRSERRRRRR